MSESLKNKTIRGTIWSSIERFSVQGIQFLVMIIMARKLTPTDYGLVGMITIFIAISQSIIDSGFSQALIRKQDRTEIDSSTVFYFNVCVGLFLYLLMWILAPIIADFYNEPILTPLTRAICLGFVFNSLTVVQRAILTLKLDFKTQAKSSLIGVIISGAAGIYMAYNNLGVWSIVIQQVLNLGIVAIVLWLYSKWKPILAYSWKSFKELFGFGSKLLISGLIDTLYVNIYLIIIGKIFKASDLGYFTRASQFSSFASSNISGIIQRVSYPILCNIQGDEIRQKFAFHKILKMTSFIVFPILMGIAAVSNPLIVSLLSKKWEFASVLLVPLCFSTMWQPASSLNINLLQTKGRSDLVLKIELIKKCISVAILCISIPFGLMTMCWTSAMASLICYAINTYYTGKIFNIGFFKQARDFLPSLLLSLTMGISVFSMAELLPMKSQIVLIICIIQGILVYFIGARICKMEQYYELISILIRK